MKVIIVNKVALVTGGSGGIGSEICRELAAEGWLVAVGYKSSKPTAERIVWEITQSGYNAEIFQCDISSYESVRNCVAQVNDRFGEINLLVNNAGIADIRLFTDVSEKEMCDLMDVDLLGAMRMTKEVLPPMIKKHYGKIINISSVWGEQGASCEVTYSAAKAGIIGFTKALAKELAPSNINVNCISCGLIDTKMNSELSKEDLNAVIDEIPSGRIGKPSDIANAVVFLADDKADYINGQTLRVDGCWI